jgi:hypothetical protein
VRQPVIRQLRARTLRWSCTRYCPYRLSPDRDCGPYSLTPIDRYPCQKLAWPTNNDVNRTPCRLRPGSGLRPASTGNQLLDFAWQTVVLHFHASVWKPASLRQLCACKGDAGRRLLESPSRDRARGAIVGTTKKSAETKSLARFLRKVLHDWEGGFPCRTKYLTTVVCDLAGLRVQPDSADTSVRFLRITDYLHLSGVLGQKHRHIRNPVVCRNGRDSRKKKRNKTKRK